MEVSSDFLKKFREWRENLAVTHPDWAHLSDEEFLLEIKRALLQEKTSKEPPPKIMHHPV